MPHPPQSLRNANAAESRSNQSIAPDILRYAPQRSAEHAGSASRQMHGASQYARRHILRRHERTPPTTTAGQAPGICPSRQRG